MTIMIEDRAVRSVLIVDDEPTLRMAFSFALQDDHTRITEAHDGADALVKLSTHEVDVILMDLRMPSIGGLEALELLRNRGDFTPVVLCSAHLTATDAQRALRHGVVDFLAKPIGLTQLRQTVSRVLDLPSSPWSEALARARRMEFEAALIALAPITLSTEQEIWADSFRTLVSEDRPPAGFFDPKDGVRHLDRLVFAH